MTEQDMVMECKKFFLHDSDLNVFCEIPFLTRSIDMVLRSNCNKLITIEFKLHDWKRAIRQAIDHSLGADEAYICLPKRKNDKYDNIIKEVIKYNIGLMVYDKDSDEKIQIVKSVDKTSCIEVYKDILIKECSMIEVREKE